MLKNNGYHMQHYFGHGDDRLSNTLMTLNLIALAFHSVCDHLCEPWQTVRSQYSRRRRFFLAIDLDHRMAVLRQLACVAQPHWESTAAAYRGSEPACTAVTHFTLSG